MYIFPQQKNKFWEVQNWCYGAPFETGLGVFEWQQRNGELEKAGIGQQPPKANQATTTNLLIQVRFESH